MDAVAALSHAELATLVEKSCLIVDLQGRMRVFAKAKENVKAKDVQAKVTEIVAPAADVYWFNETWIEEERPAPARRALFESAWRRGETPAAWSRQGARA